MSRPFIPLFWLSSSGPMAGPMFPAAGIVACLLLWPGAQRTACADSQSPADDSPPVPAPAQPDSSVPSSGPDQILERFVQECLPITPGTAPFPQSFQFGGPDGENHAAARREVLLPVHFRISRYEVTQELYELVMGRNPSRWKGPRNSAESMTYRDAVQFCQKLTGLLHSRKLIPADQVVRLPTEVEWEYCCRAGTTTRYSFGDEAARPEDKPPQAALLDRYAWHTGNAAGNDPAVGVLQPNAWGLYDMHGYLWEFVDGVWTRDGRPLDPAQPPLSTRPVRIIRGGSWKDPAALLTSSSRQPIGEGTLDDAVGFRCVIAEKPQAETR